MIYRIAGLLKQNHVTSGYFRLFASVIIRLARSRNSAGIGNDFRASVSK
jgi:hypothetical protein